MKLDELDGLKFLVALLAAKGSSGKENEPIRGTTRLEKLVFLTQREAKLGEFYEFEAYDYGPWSSALKDDIEALEAAGLVEVVKKPLLISVEEEDRYYYERESRDGDFEVSGVSEDKALFVYRLTPKGQTAGKALLEQLENEVQIHIMNLKTKFNKLPLTELLRYVYTKFPEGASESIILDKILPSKRGIHPDLPEIRRDN